MASRFTPVKWRLLVFGAAMAVVSPVRAQTAAGRGEPILFSVPAGDDGTTNTPSLTARSPVLPDFAGAARAPTVSFDAAPQTEPLPAPSVPAVVSPAATEQMQKLLDERRNWTMLTPEEILGLPTPETILGLPERDATGQRTKQTVAERYFERQESQSDTYTNGYLTADSSAQWNFSSSPSPQFGPVSLAPAKNGAGNTTVMEQFLNSGGNNNSGAAAGQTPNAGWPKLFSSPEPPPAPTPEQLAAAAEFQKLLEPRSSPPAAQTLPDNAIFSAAPAAPGPVLGQPLVNPMGASFTPLSSGISLPAGVPPLPGLFGQTKISITPVAPEWKPQLPPWMSSAPQPGVIPQPKF